MAFRRTFRRRRFPMRRRSRVDVQTLSLCGNVIQVGPTATALDCQNPQINVTPLIFGGAQMALPPLEAGTSFRGVSFKGAQYQYFSRTGAMGSQGGNPDPSLSVVSTVYMIWFKSVVDVGVNPFAPLFLPNLVIGTALNRNTPLGDPTVDIVHRKAFDIWTRPGETCEPKCEAQLTATINQYDQPMAHRASHAIPWLPDKVRTKRFIKENETLFLMYAIVSGLPPDNDAFFLLSVDLFGHIAVKGHY